MESKNEGFRAKPRARHGTSRIPPSPLLAVQSRCHRPLRTICRSGVAAGTRVGDDLPLRPPFTASRGWLANPITDSEVVKACRANALFDAHRDDPKFGQCLGADGRWWKSGGEGSDLLSLGRGLHRGGGGRHGGITRAASRRCPGTARGCQLTPRPWRDLDVDAWLRQCGLPGHR